MQSQAARQAEWRIAADAHELAAMAAKLFTQLGREAIAARGHFTVAVAGGSTPERCYRLLAAATAKDATSHEALDWSKTDLFFGDERFVPRDDPRSNYRMVEESLLGAAAIDPRRVHPIPTELGSPEQCAATYSDTLAEFFGVSPPHSWSRFDLILLGLGDDGHTASLFPGAAALSVGDRIATTSPPGVLPPPVDRVTLTFPVLNAARHVIFLVAGANKAAAVEDIWRGCCTPNERPAIGVRPSHGALTWLVDEAAASQISIGHKLA